MGYFPFFIDIKDKKCLIVGGGRVALRKARKLSAYEPAVTVVAPNICPELEGLGVKAVRRPFRGSDLDGVFLCVAASDDRQLNHHVSRLCTERGILINCVDDLQYCGFIFPSLILRGDISVGISSSGSAPSFSKYLRERVEMLLDERTLSAEKFIKKARRRILTELDSESGRAKAAEQILGLYFSSETPPDEQTISDIIERIKHDK